MFKTVFKSNLKRFWWIFALDMFIRAVFLIFPMLDPARNTSYYELPKFTLAVLSIVFGAANGIAVFSYLHFSRTVNLIHSLPSTRNAVFGANLCFGALSSLTPVLITAAVIPAAAANFNRTGDNVSFIYILVNYAIISLTFLAISSFVSMFTGNLAAAAAFTPILALLPSFIWSVIYALGSQMLYGCSSINIRLLDLLIGHDMSYTPTLICYIVLTILLLSGAYIAYRRRKMEAAGEIVTVNWAKTLFIQGVAICFGMALTILSASYSFNFILFIAIGLVFAAAAMMLLQKTWRIKGFLKQGVIFLCLTGVIFAVFQLDITGYEKRVPAAESVESLSIAFNGSRVEISDAENIDGIINAHKKIVEAKPDNGGFYSNISYKLKNGRTIERTYQLDYVTVKNLFEKVMTSEEFKKVFFQLEIDIDPETIMIWNYKQNAPKAVDIPVSRATAADIEMLREALKTDLSVCGFDQLYASEFGAGTQDFSYSMGNGSICISDEMPQTYKALSELYEKYRSDVNEAYAVYY